MYVDNASRYSANTYPAPKKTTGTATVNSFSIKPDTNGGKEAKTVAQAETQNVNTKGQPPRTGADLVDLITEAYRKHVESDEEGIFDLEPFNLTYAEYFSFVHENNKRIAAGEDGVFRHLTPLSLPYSQGSDTSFPLQTSADRYLKDNPATGAIPLEMSDMYLHELNERAKSSSDYPDNFYAVLEMYNKIDWSKYLSEPDECGNIELKDDFGKIKDALMAFMESYMNANWKKYTDFYNELLTTADGSIETAMARERLDKLLEKRPVPLDGLAVSIIANA
jgi:hypothetical protein